MHASTKDRLYKVMEDLAGVVDEIALASQPDEGFALTCAKIAAWEEVSAALRTRRVQDLRNRNALLPVHQLPVELLADIFQDTFDKNSEILPSRLKQFKKLSHVCYCWQKVVDDSPWLWTRIDGSDPSALVDEALMKSSNRLLKFSFYTQLSPKPNNLTSFLQKLDPHLNRLRKVRIGFARRELSQSHFTTIKLFTSPQPSLEYFSLCDELIQTDLSGLELFSDQAPRLKVLRLDGIRFNCRGAIFGGLNLLSLSSVTVPSLNLLLGTISRCGELQSLRLDQLWFQGVGPDPPPDRISLPALQHLSLDNIPSTLKDRFLNDIHAPQSSCFSLSLRVGSEDLEELLPRHVRKWLFSRTPSSPEITKVDITITDKWIPLKFLDANDSECAHLFLSHDKSVAMSCAVLNGVHEVLKSCVPKADVQLTLWDTALNLVEDGSYVEQLSCLSQTTMLRLGQTWCSWRRNDWETDGAQDFQLPAFPRLQNVSFHQQPSDWIIKIVRIFSAHLERQCENGRITVTIYVWKDSELDGMSSTAEKLKEIVGVERVVVSVNPESKKKGQNLG
ncbi:hypothetical protein FRC01_007340 [Tulasnella sp. 417]|nr:hypothetical protein FRC01_007340 [Tulasnella sp. 417]